MQYYKYKVDSGMSQNLHVNVIALEFLSERILCSDPK